MEWKDEYKLGIPIIDEQHKKLFEISENLTYMHDINELKEIFLFLDEYLNFHFKTEEKLMEKYNYPHLEEHKKIHDELKEKIEGYIELYFMGNFSVLDDLEELIIQWIETHILGEDKKYHSYIREK